MQNQIIENFFQNLEIEHRYFSRLHRQPIFLIREEKLYEAIKKALEILK